jgi:hypothetical protein
VQSPLVRIGRARSENVCGKLQRRARFGGASFRYRHISSFRACALFASQMMDVCGIKSFDNLTELQRHAQKLVANPAGWLPWNYR